MCVKGYNKHMRNNTKNNKHRYFGANHARKSGKNRSTGTGLGQASRGRAVARRADNEPYDREKRIAKIIEEQKFDVVFPVAVTAESETVRPFRADRRDMTKQLVITIDGADAKDFDDAVSLTKTVDGYTLSVHIADVSAYVKQKGAIDREAYSRGTSVYYPQGVIPMLPERLCNDLCSLVPNQNRLTLSVDMQFDNDGDRIGYDIYEAEIESKARMTYDEVENIYNGKASRSPEIDKMLFNMRELAWSLKRKRRLRGAVDFESGETTFVFDDTDKVIDVRPVKTGVSNGVIEEFMLAANETISEHLSRAELPCVYRVHEEPDPDKLTALKSFATTCGFTFYKQKNVSKSLQSLVKQAQGSTFQNVINTVLVRSMQKAKYSSKNIGHFGLQSKYYCHFTSPIRRYPDLVVHRIVKLALNKGMDEKQKAKYETFTNEASYASSEREYAAQLVERNVDDLLKAEYAEAHIGEKHTGIVSSVTSFGLFVELDNTVEGLLRMDALPRDRYEYRENLYALCGKKRTYRLGDRLNIVISGVIDHRLVRFELDRQKETGDTDVNVFANEGSC